MGSGQLPIQKSFENEMELFILLSRPNVPTYRFFFLKLATQKGNDLLFPKRQKMGDHRLSFGENMPGRTSEISTITSGFFSE